MMINFMDEDTTWAQPEVGEHRWIAFKAKQDIEFTEREHQIFLAAYQMRVEYMEFVKDGVCLICGADHTVPRFGEVS